MLPFVTGDRVTFDNDPEVYTVIVCEGSRTQVISDDKVHIRFRTCYLSLI